MPNRFSSLFSLFTFTFFVLYTSAQSIMTNHHHHSHSHFITGKIFPGPGRSIEYPRIGSNSRLTIQLLDVSLMDAPSITLGEQVIVTGARQTLDFPIAFKIPYDASKVRKNSHQSLSVSARVVEIPDHASAEEELTWITTTRYPVLTNGHPSDNVEIQLERVYAPEENPVPTGTEETRTSALTGRIVRGKAEAGAKIGPKSMVKVQLSDTSLMDVAAVVMGEQWIETGEEGLELPIEFKVMYDPSVIEDFRTYSVSVRVETLEGNDLTWISTSSHRVLSRDSPRDGVEVDIDQL
ncbi:putative lipoprotein [Entomortierella parvispora]|uniref:Lipoprotein n=1 Tax=Entomortierella parvispora TaxID=205924 RepID=A0A9P3H7R0_9FUNG|nr:putative lipoprotein [Entomortierella parvispora]